MNAAPQLIASLQNERVKAWRDLTRAPARRRARGAFLAEGEHMAGEALSARAAAELLVSAEQQARFAAYIDIAQTQGVSVYLLSAHVLAALSDTKAPQGILAVCALPPPPPVLGPLLVALEGVQDPGNVGTILRTMDAAGFSALLIDDKTADPFAPKALRASMGAVFRVPVQLSSALPDSLSALKTRGYHLLAGDLSGAPFFDRAPDGERVCVIIGNEGAGISPAVRAIADRPVKLPMAGGAESLNAAVAAGIIIYDILRRR